jgi:ABC-2 type transport system permease protein
LSLALGGWPAWVAAEPRAAGQGGWALVSRLEVAKLARLTRVQAAFGLCLVAPFLLAAAVKAQNTLPSDTLFGQWLDQSGWAVPMVVLTFCGQWVMPALTSVVAGDIFSAEDHFGTWKTILTRSCTRGQIFVGKAVAAAAYTVAVLTVLAAASIAAGVALGTAPVPGLSGQLVGGTQAATLVVESWALSVPPTLGFCGLALLLSVATRNSPVAVAGPVVAGLAMQVAAFVALPHWLYLSLVGTAFGAWHGLWTSPAFYGQMQEAMVASAVWFGAGLVGAWVLFRRRTVGAW